MGSDETPDLTDLMRRVRCRTAGSNPLQLSREELETLAVAARGTDEQRDHAAAILHYADITTPDAIPCLGLLLAHPNEQVRDFAAQGLRHFGVAVSTRRKER